MDASGYPVNLQVWMNLLFSFQTVAISDVKMSMMSFVKLDVIDFESTCSFSVIFCNYYTLTS